MLVPANAEDVEWMDEKVAKENNDGQNLQNDMKRKNENDNTG